MKIIIFMIVIAIIIAMFIVRREVKIALLVITEMLFLLVYIPGLPFGFAKDLVPAAFLISELPYLSSLVKDSKGSVVWKLTLLVTVSSIITIVTSPHLSNIGDIRNYIQNELFFKYFLLIYAFWCFYDDDTCLPLILKLSFYAMLVITFFGLLNYISGDAVWVSTLLSGDLATGRSVTETIALFQEGERQRIQSIFLLPFDYGYTCLCVLLLHLFAFVKKIECTRVFFITLLCCLFGIVFCNCRTILMASIISIMYFLIASFESNTKIKIVAVFITISIVSYEFIPFVHEKIDTLTTSFDINNEIEGSSLAGRILQYNAVTRYLDTPEHLLFGNGYRFFNIDLGYGNGGQANLIDKDLMGLEGVAMSYLLERGLIGFVLYLLFYLISFFYFNKQKIIDNQVSALGNAILIASFTFSNMTGELNSLYITLLLLGCTFKSINNKKKYV